MSVAVLLLLLTLCLLPEPKKLSTYSHTCIKSKGSNWLFKAQYVNSAPYCNHRLLDIPYVLLPHPQLLTSKQKPRFQQQQIMLNLH